MPKDDVIKILGFANRARKLTLGMTSTLRSYKMGKVSLVLLASDLSENASQKIKASLETKIPIMNYGTKDLFGQAFGRREVGIVGVTDPQFAKSIQGCLKIVD